MWEDLTRKMGYWVNMDDPYITYDNKYIETLWWLLKQLFDKGLLYKGYTIQPYSPAAGTGLSTHELNQPGCYRDVKDTTCTAQFRSHPRPEEREAFRRRRGDRSISWLGRPRRGPCLRTRRWPWVPRSNTCKVQMPQSLYRRVRRRSSSPKSCCARILHQEEWRAPTRSTGESRGEGPELEGIRYEQLHPVGEADGRRVPRDRRRLRDHFGRYGHRAYRADVRRRRRPRGRSRRHRAAVHGRHAPARISRWSTGRASSFCWRTSIPNS